MSRLEAVAKALFYPTQNRIIQLLNNIIVIDETYSYKPENKVRHLLDPCAGDGIPATYLSANFDFIPFGLEIHQGRADEANANFESLGGKCAHASYEQLLPDVKAADSDYRIPFRVSCLFLNPPYAYGESETDMHKTHRQELQFLFDTHKYLNMSGLLIYIVPERIMKNEEVYTFLRMNYENGVLLDYPEPEKSEFKQVVFLGQKRWRPLDYLSFNKDRDGKPYTLEPMVGYGKYTVKYLPYDDGVINFSKYVNQFNPYDVKTTLYGGAFDTPLWDMLCGERGSQYNTPLMKPRAGHLAMLLAAGCFNGTDLGNGILIKGSSEKAVKSDTTETLSDDKKTKKTKEVQTEFIAPRFSTLDIKTGEFQSWRADEDPARTTKWLSDNSVQLTQAIENYWAPQFDGDISKYSDDIVKYRAPGVLPGHTKPEFLEIQKQAAVAILHRWKTGHKCSILSGEMGVGKTTVANITIALSKEEKNIVVCPSHLVPKWIREVNTVFGSKYTAMTAKKLSDIDYFFKSNYKVLVLSKDTAKLGSRWVRSYVVKTKYVQTEIFDAQGYNEYASNHPEIYHMSAAARNEIKLNQFTKTRHMPHKYCACPDCFSPIVEKTARLNVTPSSMFENEEWMCSNPSCKGVLYQNTPLSAKGTKRWPLAAYINKHYPNCYNLIVDECHQFAKAETDQAQAIMDLCATSKKILAMTGTLYGGRASSLFWLLFKIDPSFRDMYSYSDAAKFITDHGLIETELETNEGVGRSTYSYKKNTTKKTKEIPGMNPSMIPMLLQYTVFVKLKDLQLELPPYSEEIVLTAPDPDVYQAVNSMQQEIKNILRAHPEVLSQYLMACLGYPDRCDQAESIVGFEDGYQVTLAQAPALPSRLQNKDLKVIEICEQEKEKGKQVLVYFTQVNRRDARQRLKTALEERGLKVVILDSSVSPEDRESWLFKKHEEGFDVMFTNGRLVETGMDLLFATTIIQYGIEYSIPSLRQSTRRSWRLGQKHPVKVIFLGHAGTMQETALKLIAAKMRAAEMVDGDEMGGLANFDVGGSNFLAELAQEIITKHLSK